MSQSALVSPGATGSTARCQVSDSRGTGESLRHAWRRRYGRSMPSGPVRYGWSTLTPNGQRARYGVAYVRSLCAQAGVGFNETASDEDVLAVDGDVIFAEGNVKVQIKCTSSLTIGGKTKSWPLKPEWLRKWDQSQLPVYFVIVVVPRVESGWLTHPADGTFHKTAAFWRRVEVGTTSPIKIPRTQRLTVATLDRWHSDLMAVFTPVGRP